MYYTIRLWPCYILSICVITADADPFCPQVHVARARDGRQLAVKVQHAGLRESCEVDIATIEMLVHGARCGGWRGGMLPSVLLGCQQAHVHVPLAACGSVSVYVNISKCTKVDVKTPLSSTPLLQDHLP